MINRRTFARLAAAGCLLSASGRVGLAQSSSRAVAPLASRRGLLGQVVTERSAPLVAIRFGIRAGSTEDPLGKEGLTAFLLSMLQEGAGDLNDRSFKNAARSAAAQPAR